MLPLAHRVNVADSKMFPSAKPAMILSASALFLMGCPLAVGVATYQAMELSAGCSAPLTDPVRGWPNLEIVWRIVPREIVNANCGTIYRACTHAHLELGQAWIYITPEDYADADCREHERGHAQGRSHRYGNSEWASQVMREYKR